MENIFEVPMQLTGLDAIPVPTTHNSSAEIVNSEAVTDTNVNNLTEVQKVGIEEEIKRAIENMGSVRATTDDYEELWSYDDFDNCYNDGITYEEKQAYTFWIENRMGRSQTGFFKRYSLQRDSEEILRMQGSDDNMNMDASTFKMVVRLMNAGSLFYDFTTLEFCPKYIYTTGNLWRKRAMLDTGENGELLKQRFGLEAYQQHKFTMEKAFLKVYSQRIRLTGVEQEKTLKIDINSDISKEVKVKTIILPSGAKVIESFQVFQNTRGGLDFTKGKSVNPDTKQGSAEDTHKELTLREAFMYWLRKSITSGDSNGINMFGIDWIKIYNQYMLRNNIGIGGLDETEKFKLKEMSVRVGKSLFSDFLTRGIDSQTKLVIETMWNEKYNHFPDIWDEARCSYVLDKDGNKKHYTNDNGDAIRMVTGQVPIGFQMNKRYGGKGSPDLVDIRPEKRRALSFNTITGFQSLLAYGVGIGKTWCAIFQVAQALELGICKKPIFILPNQVYPQFVREIKSILPQYKINALFNLRGVNLELSKEIEDYSITCITETGLEMLGYSPEYQENGYPESAFITLNEFNNNVNFSQVDEITKTYEKILTNVAGQVLDEESGQMVDSEKALVDKIGFDYLIVDEAHNYKNLITSVSGKVIEEALDEEKDISQKLKREPTNFEFGGKTPSGRALRLFFLTDYIQQFNPFGNTLLLTATPFTNSPLEVWSMMTYCDRNALKNTGLNVSVDFFKVFGDMAFNTEANIQGSIKETYTFVGWKNVPALQNMLFSRIDYISPDEVDLKRPNKIVFPLKSITNGQTMEIRKLSQSEQISSIVSLFGKQKKIIEDLKAYANGTMEWMPTMFEKVTTESRGITEIKYYPYEQSDIDKECENVEYIACESNWNKLNNPYYPTKNDEKGIGVTKLKWLVGEHKIDGRIVQILGNSKDEYGDLQLVNGYKLEELPKGFSDAKSTALLRSLTFQRQATISPYLVSFSGYKKMPTPKEYIESSAKLSYVMGCIESVKKHHEESKTEMSGQIIYQTFGIQAFPLVAQYCIDILGFKPSEVGIICGDKKITRTMDSVNKKGNPTAMPKKDVQNRFNGLKQNADGDFEPIPDELRVKILIGSETISEGMNLQYRSSAIYQCTLDFNPTAQTQLEGRIWRQGNPFKFVRIVNPLCADSIDIFMFQKMQDKAKHINQIWNRDGKTFMLDTREFNMSELKEACITNPYLLAMYQADEIKKELQDEISEIQFIKSKYDSVNQLIEKKVLNQYNTLETDYHFLTSAIKAKMAQMYEFAYSIRPDLIDKQLFSDSLVLKALNTMQDYENQNSVIPRLNNISSNLRIDESDFNYTLVEILEIVKTIKKENKYTLPYGFSKEATEDLKVDDKVIFERRGEQLEGVIIKAYGNGDFDVVLQDGKELEINISNNNAKKIVEVNDDEKRTFGFGSKELADLIPALYFFTQKSKQEYKEVFSGKVNAMYSAINEKEKTIDAGMIKEYADFLTPSNMPVAYRGDIETLFRSHSVNRWGYEVPTSEDGEINYGNKKFFLDKKQMQLAVGSSIQSGWNAIYEPTMLREIIQADNEFERVLIPEGITTLKELAEKRKGYDAKIEELNQEMKNVKNGEKIKERAIEIIRKRAEESISKDNALKDGDWKTRVKDFASLNCLLDMKANVEKAKIEVRTKDKPKKKTLVTQRSDELEVIQEKLNALNGLLEVFDGDSNEYIDTKEKIEALELTKSIYE
jgi:hypothetical protein